VSGPFDAVRALEAALCEFTGASHAICTTSCTEALLVVCAYLQVKEVEIPRRTFVGVAQSILNAGGTIKFRDEEWAGIYELRPYPIIDAARRFRVGMYVPGTFMCLSHHLTKICGFTDGGCILHDSDEAAKVLHRMCYDGRPLTGRWHPEQFVRGFHCSMAPSTAAGVHRKLATLPRENADLPNSDYPDLSTFPIFKS
jgi:dTDP-4-amino-4,6-dideoxygalactose transaminase